MSVILQIQHQFYRLKISAIDDPGSGLTAYFTDQPNHIIIRSRSVIGLYEPRQLLWILKSLKTSDTTSIWGAIAPAECPTYSTESNVSPANAPRTERSFSQTKKRN
jgi:hypothetical protein